MRKNRYLPWLRYSLCSLLFAAALSNGASAQTAPVGYVRVANGEVFIVKQAERIAAKIGDPVATGDVLETGASGSLGITFRDDSRISLGPNTELSLKAYEFEPAEARLSFVARIARGTLLYISGLIAKLSPDGVAVETPVATLAVRGTRFLVRVDDED